MDSPTDPIRPTIGWFLLLDGGLLALTVVALIPPLAARLRARVPLPSDRVLRLVLLGALLTHVAEGLAAGVMARSRGRDAAAWAIQTTIVGFPSLRLLAATPSS